MSKMEDRFTNIVQASVTMSAANETTYTEIATGVSLGSGLGMLIDHIEYQPTVATLRDMDDDGDQISMGWVTNNTQFNYGDQTTIDIARICRLDGGTAANMVLREDPVIKFYNPPIIVAAPRLYLAMGSSGLTVAGSCNSRLYFRYIPLTDKEFLELAETFILVG